MSLFDKTLNRRTLLKSGTVAVATIAAPSIVRGAEPPPVKVGILQPVTGAVAMDGEFGRTGAELAIADINAAGGIKSLGGAKIQMIFGDARSNPEAGVQEVERMQSEGVAAIVGGFASPICLATTQAAARYDLPYIVDVGVSDQIIERGLKNTFRFAPGFGICTKTAIENLVRINEAAGKPAKTIALVHEDGLFGSGLAKLMQQELPKHGFEILETMSTPTPSRDLSNITLRLRSLNPDLVIPSTYYAETVLLARTMQQQRVRPKAIYAVVNGAASNMRFVKEFPEAAEKIMDCNHWHDPRNPKNEDLRKRVEAAGKQWNYNVPLNYSCVGLLADAIERAASADRGKIIEALASSTYDKHLMPYGPTKFVGGQNQGAAPVATQVQDGVIRVVYPETYSDAKPVFPVRA
ncbi:ABC transporter substrate-binding protein [Microvirga guangxiensis]|uniref:Amino acid/amide ABC transporter substrate-binding protein, HAAT family n=1 Tax=Microvirga guangxiensis TaxID=549386 RepID=A0A1G5LAV8_9HYPH|nr:ABC transporter substrate-binding protein [Microvirga guangxiensis]SCZ10035.1 amino acid/amide ABC transporter substrate-binding protein, HAAT family [Microvirga guangxiensis]